MAFDISMVDQTPVPRTQARPAYPRVAGAAGEKRVVVDFIVGVDGKVSGAYAIGVADTEVDRAFAQAATDAVQKWTFKPGRKGGRDVAVHMRVPIVFKR